MIHKSHGVFLNLRIALSISLLTIPLTTKNNYFGIINIQTDINFKNYLRITGAQDCLIWYY